uniref:(California timema) hypothetical protein n=1 Tax=Timema californicum TaxID=61474 RepID=A0A7R9PCY5_TIMCA|nr:unnamed protein product [Timema californicum]
MQTYHLEVELPLLEHKLRSREEPPEFEEWKPKEEDKIQNDIDREKYARKNNVKNGNKDKQGKGKYSIEKEKPFQEIVDKKKVIKEKTKVRDEKKSKANGGGKTSASVEKENTVKYNVEDKDLHKEYGKTKNELDIGRATRMEAERNKRPSVFPDTRMSIFKSVSKECELNVEEALAERRRIPCFKTERIPWSKIIEYPDPSIEVPTPNDDLEALRDTMRSSVRTRIVFMQWLEPDKVKAPKQKTGEPKLPPKDPVEETILRREVVAEFDTHLEQVDWSERTVDYTWSLEGDQVPVRANKATDRLKVVPTKGGQDSSSNTWKLLEISLISAKRPPKKKGGPTLAFAPLALPIPEAITCHFGFGLKRI